jgi:hypothetical protein
MDLLLLVGLLAVLWIIDMVETLKLMSKLGDDVELNPFVKFLIKKNREEFILFKLVDLAVVVMIVLFVYSGEKRLGISLLMSFITLYIFVVVHNFRIYKKYCV